MTAASFDLALGRVLRHEGGFSNHPADPGGPTNRGVIQRVYDAYRRSKDLPTRSVRALQTDEMRDIYRRQYWDAVRADELPTGLDYAVFDAAVNSGPAQAAKWLQRALGVVDDGQVGGVTIAAARAAPDLIAVIQDVCDRRLAMLRGLKTWPTFGRGWAARVADVRSDAAGMISGPAEPADNLPPASPKGAAKAPAADIGAMRLLHTPEGAAGGVAIATAALNAATDPGPLQWALAAAVFGAVVIAAVYLLRRIRAAA